MAEYQVSYRAFKHITVEADSKEEALEKADADTMGFWNIEEERAEGPY